MATFSISWDTAKKTQKTKPIKKIPETDAIFENVFAANQQADHNPYTLGLSIDSKAKVKIGNLSRGGKDRRLEPLQANGHNSEWLAVLVPFGILNTETNQFSIYFGQSAETSDFIVDCLHHWWRDYQAQYHHLDELTIDLAGGLATRSDRTQFIKRMVEFSQATRLKIHLICYSPYHSKYNPIERRWAALENYWNGTVLDSIQTAIQWTANLTWKGMAQSFICLILCIREASRFLFHNRKNLTCHFGDGLKLRPSETLPSVHPPGSLFNGTPPRCGNTFYKAFIAD